MNAPVHPSRHGGARRARMFRRVRARYDRAVKAQEKPAPACRADRSAGGRFSSQRHRRSRLVDQRRLDAAPAPPARWQSVRHAIQVLYSKTGIYFLDRRHRPQAHGHHERRLHGPLERGRIRGLPLDRRAASGLLRVPDLAAQPGAADPDPELRRPVPRLASLALREGSASSARPRITGGPKQSGATIQGWRAEFFIPYAVLRPLQNVPPKPGTSWRRTSTGWITTRASGRSGTGRRSAIVPRVSEVRGTAVRIPLRSGSDRGQTPGVGAGSDPYLTNSSITAFRSRRGGSRPCASTKSWNRERVELRAQRLLDVAPQPQQPRVAIEVAGRLARAHERCSAPPPASPSPRTARRPPSAAASPAPAWSVPICSSGSLKARAARSSRCCSEISCPSRGMNGLTMYSA